MGYKIGLKCHGDRITTFYQVYDLNHLDLKNKKITDLNHLHRLVCYEKNVYGVLCIMFKNN